MKTVPYTTSTGIQIGVRYNESPKPMPIDDPDMEYIQSLLIHSGAWHRQKRIEQLIHKVSVALFLIIVFFYMMVQK
jgi:hypothetical protein